MTPEERYAEELAWVLDKLHYHRLQDGLSFTFTVVSRPNRPPDEPLASAQKAVLKKLEGLGAIRSKLDSTQNHYWGHVSNYYIQLHEEKFDEIYSSCNLIEKDPLAGLPLIAFDKPSGDGSVDGTPFNLRPGTPSHALFSACFLHIRKSIGRAKVLTLLRVNMPGDNKSVGRNQSEESRAISTAASKLRKKTGLNTEQLRVSGNTIILYARTTSD